MPRNTTLEKTCDEDCVLYAGHLCPTETYNLRRKFFHGCVSDIYTRLVRIRGTEVVQ